MRHSRSQPFVALAGSLAATAALACPDCPTARAARASVLGGDFWQQLVMVAVPFLLVGMLGALRNVMAGPSRHQGPILSAGVLLGAGLGGFVDGILLHQLLQWHNMLSSRIPPTDLVSMKVNMLWDGLFHACTWLMTVVGIGLLWRAGKRPEVPWSTRTLLGSLAIGWGAFNVVEGLIDHQWLGIHHVRPGAGQLAWDMGFLLFGALLVAVGQVLVRAGRRDTRPRGAGAPTAPERLATGRA